MLQTRRTAPYPLWQVPILFGIESIAVLILVRAVTIDPEHLNDQAALSIAFFAAVLAAAGIRTVIIWRRQKNNA